MGLIKKPNELTVKTTLSALIYGQPGMGKTTFALSSPHPLLLDFDGGIHRVNAAHRVDTVQITKWEEVNEVLSSPEVAEYKTFVKRVTMMGKCVVFVAHEREEKVGEEKQIRPEIGGSSAGDLIKELDLVGYMEAIGKKRTISFSPCEKFYAKNTCNLQSPMEIPGIIDDNGNPTGANDFMEKIIKSYMSYQEKQTELSGEYEALMEVITAKVDMVTDADTANEVSAEILNLTHIFDSKLRGAVLLNDRCKQLGLKLNKTTKKYEAA